MLSSEPTVLLLPDELDGRLVIPAEERREIVRRLRRGAQLEEENADLREKLEQAKERERQLEAEKQRLREEIRRLKTSFPMLAADEKTAEAVGVPSSQQFYRRPHPVGDLKHTGGQPGHRGHARERPIPNSPPEIFTLDRCPDCHTKLRERCDVLSRVITEPPPPQPKIFEVQNERYHCSGCGRRVVAPDPYPPHRHFGFLLSARVVHLRMLGLSIEKVVDCMREGHGVELSSATVLNMERWAANALGPLYERLKEEVRRHDVVQADETKFRVRGENGWMWVFVTLSSVVYRIADTRGQSVVREVLDGYTGTLVSDAWDPYDVVTTAKRQLDNFHVNRWLEHAEIKHRLEPRPLMQDVPPKLTSAGRPPEEFLRFADGVRRILREVILWSESHPEAPGRVRRRVKKSAERAMRRHLNQPWQDEDAVRIAKELKLRRRMLFTYVVEPGVPWHNNAAENQIRQGVLFRKISGGRRSWLGAAVLERLLTVYRTCRKRQFNFLDVVLDATTGKGYPKFSTSGQPES